MCVCGFAERANRAIVAKLSSTVSIPMVVWKFSELGSIVGWLEMEYPHIIVETETMAVKEKAILCKIFIIFSPHFYFYFVFVLGKGQFS